MLTNAKQTISSVKGVCVQLPRPALVRLDLASDLSRHASSCTASTQSSLQVGRNESGTIPSILVFLVIKSIHFKFWRACDWLRLASHVMPRATVCGCVVVLGVAWATAPMQTERIVEQRRGLLWTASLHLQPLWDCFGLDMLGPNPLLKDGIHDKA